MILMQTSILITWIYQASQLFHVVKRRMLKYRKHKRLGMYLFSIITIYPSVMNMIYTS